MTQNINKRPLSPHISIYKPQISSCLSIMHRIAGAYLFVGMMLLVWWIIIGVYFSSVPELAKWDFFISNKFGKFLIFCWSAALFYHSLNGIRHLFWDIGKGFELSAMKTSGIFVIIGTILLTIISWGIAYNN